MMISEIASPQVVEKQAPRVAVSPPLVELADMYPDVTTETIEYPESDGKPVAETEVHVIALLHILDVLRYYFRNEAQVYVGGNMLMYYEKGSPHLSVAPDVFVVRGVPKYPPRRTYKLWEEGRAPDVVFEFTSKSTKWEDLATKKGLYEFLGVTEYFLFDPLDEYLSPNLRGYRLAQGSYQPIATTPLVSQVLNLELRGEGTMLRLYDLSSGERLPTLTEAQDRVVQAEARVMQEEQARYAAEARAQAAEAEAARLRTALAQLRGTDTL